MIQKTDYNILLIAAYFEAARAHLERLATVLRRRPEITDVFVHFAPREYASGLMIETYVEAELTDGRALLWWLEMGVGPECRVEAALAVTDNTGQRTLETVQESVSTSLPEALRAFAAAAESLAQHSDVTAIFNSTPTVAA